MNEMRIFKIKRCQDCPYYEGLVWLYDISKWEVICGYWNSVITTWNPLEEDIKIPDWCPLPKEEVK